MHITRACSTRAPVPPECVELNDGRNLACLCAFKHDYCLVTTAKELSDCWDVQGAANRPVSTAGGQRAGPGQEPLPSLVPLDGPVSEGRTPRTHHTLDQLQLYRGPVAELQGPSYRVTGAHLQGYSGPVYRPSYRVTEAQFTCHLLHLLW